MAHAHLFGNPIDTRGIVWVKDRLQYVNKLHTVVSNEKSYGKRKKKKKKEKPHNETRRTSNTQQNETKSPRRHTTEITTQDDCGGSFLP